MKKIWALLLTLTIICSFNIPVYAAENTDTITYTIYDENGNFVKEGIWQPNAKASWGSVTLASGQTVSFKNSGLAFKRTSGTSMTFAYALSSSATVVCRIMKASSYTASGSAWSTTTKTASSGAIGKTADETAYYYPQITNSSTSYITVTSALFD